MKIEIKSEGMTNSSKHRQEKNHAVDLNKVFDSRFPTIESLAESMKFYIEEKDNKDERFKIEDFIKSVGDRLLTIYETFKDDEIV